MRKLGGSGRGAAEKSGGIVQLVHIDISRSAQDVVGDLLQIRQYPALVFVHRGKKAEYSGESDESGGREEPLEHRLLRFLMTHVVSLPTAVHKVVRDIPAVQELQKL